MKPTVFVHTNAKQIVGAIVSKYSFGRFAADPSAFEVKLIETASYSWMRDYEGKLFLRDGLKRRWLNDDLQSFTVLRFAPPEIMRHEGRSLVVDPDVFCISSINELLARDMGDAAILARHRTGSKEAAWASSVMLLDNARLTHWNLRENFDEMFAFKRDYMKWITLLTEPQDKIAPLESVWNDFDRLTPETRMIHNTKRQTQPWKSGLPVDFRPPESRHGLTPKNLYHRLRRSLFGDYGLLGSYKSHPDPNQERLFFALLRECLDRGLVSEAMLRQEMKHNHIRHDALDLVRRTPTLDEKPLFAA
ncbi:hypothetical protein [Aestuariivirga sp.]|uniref:hypothetical protein n=1 Tax=Aestuariivirga sp. TaxID=2650926 RepID=UPI0025BBDDB9|nr:hypothetical protein [Aestuariivirga sp.]MCA3554846.1 hypothetical protein [Aestuariivirga sp.]